MDPDVARLADCLDDLQAFLAGHGEARWADRVASDAALVRRGDGFGVSDLLSAFGGMGSLSDLVFSPLNGNATSDAEAAVLNDQFARLRAEAWTAADRLRRSG